MEQLPGTAGYMGESDAELTPPLRKKCIFRGALDGMSLFLLLSLSPDVTIIGHLSQK